MSAVFRDRIALAVLVSLLIAGWAAYADEAPAKEPGKPRWTPFVRGGYVHQFETDIDDGGEFDSDRLFLQAGASYSIAPGRRVSLSVGYGRDNYGFSGNKGFAGDSPWKNINQFRFSAPVFWAVDKKWSLYAIPTVRFAGETDTDLNDSGTGGVLAGFSYRFSDTLTLGPGIGVISQLEDSASIFPIVIVDWKITERLRLETGGGLGATRGPGLTLSYKVNNAWNVALGGRYESYDFRLNDSGPAPDGVGRDRSFPLFVSATYSQGRKLQVSALAGAEIGGELRLQDSKGKTIAKEDYDTAPFLGFSFSYRF